MGIFGRRKSRAQGGRGLGDGFPSIVSGLVFITATERARITLGFRVSETESDDDSGILLSYTTELVSNTVLSAIQRTWTDAVAEDNAKVFVAAVMQTYAAFIASQAAGLSEEDRMLVELGFAPQMNAQFGVEIPEVGGLLRDAGQAVAAGMNSEGGRRYFSDARIKLLQFRNSGDENDLIAVGEHFRPMLKSVR